MRLSINNFMKGLWTIGGKESTMQGYLRRTRGMHAIRTPSLRSRSGSTELYTTDGVTAITQFAGDDFYLAGTTLYKNGTGTFSASSSINTGVFLKLPPQPGQADQMFFLCDGTTDNRKIDSSGTVTKWGINVTNPLSTITVADNGVGAMAAGTYRYHVVFVNGTTGSRSNPTTNANSLTQAASRQIRLTNIPTSADSQVTQREIYRTVANGARYFRVTTLGDNTTTAYNDNTSDANLQSFELQFDNLAPQFAVPNSFDFLWAWTTLDHRVWWLDTDGNAYYSPAGRPESVRGFIKVGTSEDVLVRGLSWNGANWIFTRARLFRVFGDDEPFVALPIDGVPGTDNANAITITPYGIAYLSYDGVYLFDGSRAQLLGYDEIAPVFRGEAQENLDAVILTQDLLLYYANQQLYLCNQTNNGMTLVYDFRSQTWRDLGLKITALYKEQQTRDLLASFNDNVYVLEDPGTTDDDPSGIAIEWEIGGALTDIAHFGTVQRVYLDINTNTTSLTVTLLVDGASVSLGNIAPAARTTIELPVPSGWQGRVFSVRLSGTAIDPVELFGVAVDVKLEGAQPELGVG